MRLNRPALIAIALSIATPALVSAAERMQPGLWEVTATVELPGTQSPAPTTQTECLSQKDVDADPAPVLDTRGCRVTDARRSGDKVTWKLDCGQVGKGEGEIVYRSPTACEGWMTLETGGTVVRTTIRARRIGACR